MISNMTQTYFSLFAQEIGASTAAIGLMVTLRALLPIFLAMPIGQMIDSFGPVRMMKYGSAAMLLTLATLLFARGVPLLALSQVVYGLSIIIMATALQVLVSEGSGPERNDSIKKYAMWMSAGNMAGPLVGGVIVSLFASKLTGYLFTFAFACTGSVVFIVALLIVSQKYKHTADAPDRRSLQAAFSIRQVGASYKSGLHLTRYRSVRFGLVATFLIMYIQSMFTSFMPIYLNELGYPILLIALMIALKDLASMLSRFALGWILRLTNMERVLLGAGFLAALGILLIPLAGIHAAGFMVLTAMMGGALGLNMPVSIMIMVNETQEDERGKLMGLRLIVNRLSQSVSPTVFGLIGQFAGLTLAFAVSGALLTTVMIGFSVFMIRRGGK